VKDITESEVLQALQDATGLSEDDSLAFTPTEAKKLLAEAGHVIGMDAIRVLFRELVESGVAEVRRVKRANWDGTLVSRSGIHFLGNGK